MNKKGGMYMSNHEDGGMGVFYISNHEEGGWVYCI